MTDLKPGSQWLLPVTFNGYMEPDGAEPKLAWLTLVSGRVLQAYPRDTVTLIPADRITELEAKVFRLEDTLEMISKFSDDSTMAEWAESALKHEEHNKCP